MRIIRTLFIGYLALFLVLTGSIPTVRADEIDVLGQAQQIINQTGTGITVDDILKASGLDNKTIRDICVAGNVLKRIEGIVKNFGNILKQELGGIISDILRTTAKQLVTCAVKGALGSIPVVGGFLGGAGGGECVTVSASDVGGIIKQRADFLYKQNFVANCGAAVAMDSIGKQFTLQLHSQGPDGGPAWVTDYVTTLNRLPDQYAQRRVWAILANTNMCKYFREDVLDYFGVPGRYRNNPPSGNFAVSGNAPFHLRAACTLPENFDPKDVAALQAIGGLDVLVALAQPQNNPSGFISMVQNELISQQAAMRASLYAQVVGGGGFLPFAGECQKDPNGKCLDQGTITRPAGGVRDFSSNLDATELEKLANTNAEQNQAVTDIATKIKLRLLDLANQPLPFKIEFGPQADSSNFAPAYTPSPLTPDDLVCTGGDSSNCVCIQNDADAKFVAQTTILQATNEAAAQHPELLTPDGISVLPGQNYPFLQAVCASSKLSGSNCYPNPNSATEIAIESPGATLTFEILTPNNVIRRPGQPVALCSVVF